MRKRRGAALLFTMFFLFLLYGLASGFIALIPNELRHATRMEDDTQVFYVADAGIAHALAQMEYQVNTDSNTFETMPGTFWVQTGGVGTFTDPGSPNPTAVLTGPNDRKLLAVRTFRGTVDSSGTGTYEVVIERWAYLVNGERLPDAYRISSRAINNNKHKRTVQGWAMQKNFSQYAYCVNTLPSTIWLNLNTFKLDGPYHTNDKLYFAAPSNYNDGFGSSFMSQVSVPRSEAATAAGIAGNPVIDGVNWHNNTNRPYDYAGVPNATKYQRVIDGGLPRFHRTAADVALPKDASKIGKAAFGADLPAVPGSLTHTAPTSVFGTAGAVNLHIKTNLAGGPYPSMEAGMVIEGDVDDLQLSAPGTMDGNGNPADDNTNSQMILQQGSRQATITSVYESMTIPAGARINGVVSPSPTTLSFNQNNVGYTVIREGTTNNYRVFSGTGNGAIYAEGDILSLRGTNRGRKTIATMMDSGNSTSKDKEILITGNLTRRDTPAVSTTGPVGPTSFGAPKPTGNKVADGMVRDQLGLVAYAVRLKEDSTFSGVSGVKMTPNRSAQTATNPLLIYAAIFAGRADDPLKTDNTYGGGMGTRRWNQGTGGSFRLYGSLTEGTRQVKGTFGGTDTGYDYQYYFDTNFRSLPPPFFPGTSGFQMATWTEPTQREN